MKDHVDSALFVYTRDTKDLIKRLQNNPFGVKITPVAFDTLMRDPEGLLDGVGHAVVSGALDVIKTVLGLAMKYDFSVGLVPMHTQKGLRRYYALPGKSDAIIDLALRQDAQVMDLILCNQKVVLFEATIGRLPLMDSPGDISRLSIVVKALKRFIGLELFTFSFTTSSKQKIKTAACGCMIVQHHEGTLASRLISHDSSFTDGMISLLVSAPLSIIEYLKFLGQSLKRTVRRKPVPSTIGYIKSPQIDIESERELRVFVDGEPATHTPLHCETIQEAVRINIGTRLREKRRKSQPAKERINIDNLPIGKELLKAKKKTIPFFPYASEERFRDLFIALREDARINPAYLVLMVFSTMLATVGLYLDSASVVIGAMLLAPLMAPIVSLAMGLLRQDGRMSKRSAKKIIIGIIIALLAAALITLLFPHKPMTGEMEGRLQPTLLDLAVAVIAGIAGAYTKSFKEILQSLAGVSIAVALVPPLAVAGIGIGRWDFYFFGQAFLLFATNLIGIILAATFTFRVLGYSAAVRSKRNIGLVALFLVLITIPLYLSYNRIVETMVFETSWQQERFLVNGKYLIVKKAELSHHRDKEVIVMDIMAREPLTREDLAQFKRKIQANFAKKLIIRASTIYIP